MPHALEHLFRSTRDLCIFEHPLSTLHLLHDLVSIPPPQGLAPSFVGGAPTLRQVSTRRQPMPALPALGAEAEGTLGARREHATLPLVRRVLQRGILAARAPHDILHLVERRLQQLLLIPLVQVWRDELLHLRRRGGDAAPRVRAQQRRRRAPRELRGEVAADARPAEGVRAADEADAVEGGVRLEADGARVQRRLPLALRRR
mmetsp:Transcript_46639/g.115648  ORF Transcript_46639/g.115648 Transcript_46639/m.115648 type:complete len:203 (+) Transcript_46639:451-1059(+)